MVQNGEYGHYYSVWSSIAERADVKQAGLILLSVLYTDSTYTIRANCAQALLAILDEKQIQYVDISADRPDQPRFLKEIEKKISVLLQSK